MFNVNLDLIKEQYENTDPEIHHILGASTNLINYFMESIGSEEGDDMPEDLIYVLIHALSTILGNIQDNNNMPVTDEELKKGTEQISEVLFVLCKIIRNQTISEESSN